MINAECNDFAKNDIADQEPIQITADICESVNFAMQQNHVPIVRSISIYNNTGSDIEKLRM